MQLTAEQKEQVGRWIEGGAKLAEIQQKLGDVFDVRLTYMEARFLIDDLKLKLQDPELPAEPAAAAELPASGQMGEPIHGGEEQWEEPAGMGDGGMPQGGGLPQEPSGGGAVSVGVDTIARPGTMVSGSVTFSDGKSAAWYLDQHGQLGVTAEDPGYRPPPADLPEFQNQLRSEMKRLGYY